MSEFNPQTVLSELQNLPRSRFTDLENKIMDVSYPLDPVKKIDRQKSRQSRCEKPDIEKKQDACNISNLGAAT